MKLYLTNQEEKFKEHLVCLKAIATMSFTKSRLSEKVSFVEINTDKKLETLNLSFLFNYEIFPQNIMSSFTQWNDENRTMKIGDTIVQQVFIPPIKSFSQKIIFGVRITEIINLKTKKGFSYETLPGHAEKGISTFTVEQVGPQKLIFKIHTHSASGNIISKILSPFFSIPYQTFCTKSALANVKRIIEAQ